MRLSALLRASYADCPCFPPFLAAQPTASGGGRGGSPGTGHFPRATVPALTYQRRKDLCTLEGTGRERGDRGSAQKSEYRFDAVRPESPAKQVRPPAYSTSSSSQRAVRHERYRGGYYVLAELTATGALPFTHGSTRPGRSRRHATLSLIRQQCHLEGR